MTTIEQTVVHSTVEQVDQQPTKEENAVKMTNEQLNQEETRQLTSPTESTEEPVNPPSTPIYSQIHKTKETIQTESPYSTLKSSPTPPPMTEEKRPVSPTNYTVEEIVQAGIAEPPAPQLPATRPASSASPTTVTVVTTEKPTKGTTKSSKKSVSIDGLVKIVQDHQERAHIYQTSEKPADEVSYFRVAKSRFGKFETDDRGFVSHSAGVFENTEKNETTSAKTTEITVKTCSNNKTCSTTATTVERKTSV